MVLLNIRGNIIGHTSVQDYVFWPVECNQMSLYDWIWLSEVEKRPNIIEQNYNDDDDVNGAESNNENDIDSNDKDDKVTFYTHITWSY